MFALSRHENKSECGLNMCQKYKKAVDGYLSHDAFVFIPPLPGENMLSVTGRIFYRKS